LNYDDPETSLEDALGLNFVVQEERFGEKLEYELKPNGHNIMVTEENSQEYINLQINYIFNK
jgi:E3 ubiquitin-protein ligase NEDD4